MALLTMKRGPSTSLATIKAKEGQLLFTPDDGALYIDIAGNGSTTPVIGRSTTLITNANRIKVSGPIEQLEHQIVVNGIIFNGSEDKNIGTIEVNYGGTGNTAFVGNRLVFSNKSTQLSSASYIYATNNGIGINQETITPGYVFEVSGKSQFFDNAYFAKIYAEIFHGNLAGNAATATRARQDNFGNEIYTTYLRKGGENGQILIVSSNNNQKDYIWINPTTQLTAYKVSHSFTINGKVYNGINDIDAGTIGIAYGGTGKISWIKDGILYADTTDNLSQITASNGGAILITNTNTTPKWLAAGIASNGNNHYILQTNGNKQSPSWVNAATDITAYKVSETLSFTLIHDNGAEITNNNNLIIYDGSAAKTISTKTINALNLSGGTIVGTVYFGNNTNYYIDNNGIANFKTIISNIFKGNLAGNAASATKAEQDSFGNIIINTYLKKYGGISGQILKSTGPNTEAIWVNQNTLIAGSIEHSITFTNIHDNGASAGIITFNGSSDKTISSKTLNTLNLAGGTITGTVYFANGDTYYIDSNGNAKFNQLNVVNAVSFISDLTVTGNTILLSTLTINAQSNTQTILPNKDNDYNIGASGNKYLNVYATTFHGGVDGNASTATGWFTAATITVGNKSNTLQNGGQSITYTLNDIGLNAAGSAKHPVYISATGVPVACNSATATTMQNLEAVSAGGSIGLYSNGSNTCGQYVTMTNDSMYYYMRISTNTTTAPQASWYCVNNFRDSIYLWSQNSTTSSTSPYINFYRSAGSSGNNTSGAYHEWGAGSMASMYVLGGYKTTNYTDGTATSTTSLGTSIYFIQRSINVSTGTYTAYYEYYHLPSCTNNKTGNSYYTILTSKYAVTVSEGGTGKTSWTAGHLIYSSGTATLANTAGITTDGYSIDISATYYPEFTLTATTTNSLSKYSRATFQGDYGDNVAMWIYSDKTTTSNSRRGLVVKGYAAQTDDNLALVYRRCNTSGTWQSDQYILTSGNWSNWISIPSTTSLASLMTIGSSSTTHATALQNYFNSYKSTTPRNATICFYDASGGNGSLAMGYFLSGYDSTPYGGFFVAHYGTPYYVGIQNGTFAQAQLWKAGDSVTSAVWNDYAEYRQSECKEPGRVVIENGDDTLSATTERLQHFAGIVSDTWGFAQGKTENAKTPLAVAGRVLAYPYRDRNEYKPGDCVCTAPNGTVDIMTREEIVAYPDRIVGTVSCVPDYDTWGGGDRDPVNINGRIWIKVK